MASLASPASHGWWKLSLALPGDLEESLLWKLPELGVHRVAVVHRPLEPLNRELQAWLPQSDWSEADLQALEQALAPLGDSFALQLPPLSWERVADEDWSLSWKQHWAPDPIGATLLVLPAWLEVPEEAQGRRVIRLDPGPAFGTGSHPSTRLCLEGLEALAASQVGEGAPSDQPLKGLRVADLGCGSGLLGLAALALGAEWVYAVDTDPLAIRATQENAALNGVQTLSVREGSTDELESLLQGEPADVLLCNILAPVIAELCSSFPRLLRPSGLGLLSGLLVTQANGLLSRLREQGWEATLAAVQEPWARCDIRHTNR
ncbi:MAG: 50S ribosomal protein L11 methyltransferase [Cyanobium sp.]